MPPCIPPDEVWRAGYRQSGGWVGRGKAVAQPVQLAWNALQRRKALGAWPIALRNIAVNALSLA